MRIKSYFDSSIPTAMRQARNEFGDEVMLVTSRITAPEFRYLGEYEVVFAVDGSEPAAEKSRPEPAASTFGEVLQEQLLQGDSRIEESREEAIAKLDATIRNLGIDPVQAELLVALIHSCMRNSPEPDRQKLIPLAAEGVDSELRALPVVSGSSHTDGSRVPVELMVFEPTRKATSTPLEPAIVSTESLLSLEEGSIRSDSEAPEIVRTPVASPPCESKQIDHCTRVDVGRRSVQNSKRPTKSGFTIMLAALGVFGMIRSDRQSKR